VRKTKKGRIRERLEGDILYTISGVSSRGEVPNAAFKDATAEPPPVGHLGCDDFERQQALCTRSFLPVPVSSYRTIVVELGNVVEGQTITKR
jgi:hypothetical protein